MFARVQIHQIIHNKYVQFFIYQLYHNKTILFLGQWSKKWNHGNRKEWKYPKPWECWKREGKRRWRTDWSQINSPKFSILPGFMPLLYNFSVISHCGWSILPHLPYLDSAKLHSLTQSIIFNICMHTYVFMYTHICAYIQIKFIM